MDASPSALACKERKSEAPETADVFSTPTSGTVEVTPHRIHSKCKHEMVQPRVACSGPFRLHVLVRSASGRLPSCDCGRQHAVFGETYRYCTCGLSATQPWCDDSHAGTCFNPQTVVCDKRQAQWLVCGCKRTSKPPECDGSHVHIGWADLEW